MKKIQNFRQIQIERICKSLIAAIGISAFAVFASGLLKLSLTNNDLKLSRIHDLLLPVAKTLTNFTDYIYRI